MKEKNMHYDTLLELVKGRRSIRKVKPDPIPDEFIDKMIEAARWAPSAKNSQPWEFVVVKNKDVKDKIAALVNQDRFNRTGKKMPSGYAEAPVFIILCGNDRYHPPDNLGRWAYSLIYSTLGNAFLYMALAATTLGLGSQWVSAVASPHIEREIKDLLLIPKKYIIFDMLAVGYPDMTPKPRPLREREGMVHYDHFDMDKP
jgi:nitroreductase